MELETSSTVIHSEWEVIEECSVPIIGGIRRLSTDLKRLKESFICLKGHLRWDHSARCTNDTWMNGALNLQRRRPATVIIDHVVQAIEPWPNCPPDNYILFLWATCEKMERRDDDDGGKERRTFDTIVVAQWREGASFIVQRRRGPAGRLRRPEIFFVCTLPYNNGLFQKHTRLTVSLLVLAAALSELLSPVL